MVVVACVSVYLYKCQPRAWYTKMGGWIVGGIELMVGWLWMCGRNEGFREHGACISAGFVVLICLGMYNQKGRTKEQHFEALPRLCPTSLLPRTNVYKGCSKCRVCIECQRVSKFRFKKTQNIYIFEKRYAQNALSHFVGFILDGIVRWYLFPSVIISHQLYI